MVTDGSKRVNCSFTIVKCRCGGLVVNVMDSGSRGLGLRPGHVNVWDKTIYSQNASLSPPRSICGYWQIIRGA